mgnify:CR=1 FL=1
MYNILIIGCEFTSQIFYNLLEFNKTEPLFDSIVNISELNNVPESIKYNSKYHYIEFRSKNLNFLNILKKYKITHVINFLSKNIEDLNTVYNLIQDCIKWDKIEKFIHISSNKILSDRMPDTRLNVLSEDKYCLHSCIESIVRQSSINTIIARTCKIYCKEINNIITRFISILRENKVIELEGNGSDTMGFIHVKDFCSAITLILHKGVVGKVYDICPDRQYMVLDLARELCYLFWKDDSSIRFKFVNKNKELFKFTLNNNNIKNLGWKQKITLSEGLKNIIKH